VTVRSWLRDAHRRLLKPGHDGPAVRRAFQTVWTRPRTWTITVLSLIAASPILALSAWIFGAASLVAIAVVVAAGVVADETHRTLAAERPMQPGGRES